MKKFFSTYGRQLVLLAVLGIVVAVLSRMSPYFLNASNLLGLSRHLAEAGIIACGMTFIIMTGGIDLSVGSLLALAGIVLGYTWKPLGPAGAITAAMLTGAIGGSLNGALIAKWSLPPLVVTLATMALYRGTAMVISKAQPVSGFPESFSQLGQGTVGETEIPQQLVIWLVLVVISIILIDRTPVGRYVMAVGDNERAARFAALPVAKVKFLIYAVTGVLCGLAALIFTARVSTAKADAGMGLELEVITAVVLGGTAITGGRGTVFGTFLGVVILGLLRNGLSLAGVASVYQSILAGGVLIIVAIGNQRILDRAARRKPKLVAGPELVPAQ